MAIEKTFRYEVLDSNGTYKGDFNDVIKSPTFTWDINSAGSQVVIQRATKMDSFGEGGLVDFRNKVNIYALDAEAPNGTIIFSGYISAYRPVGAGTDQHLEITLLGYGAELSQYLVQNTIATDQSQTSHDSLYDNSSFVFVAQSFQTGSGISNVNSVDLYIDASAAAVDGTLTLVLNTALNSPVTSGELGEVTVSVRKGFVGVMNVAFASPISVSPLTTYYFIVGTSSNYKIGYQSTNLYANGNAWAYGSGWVTDAPHDMYFVTYAGNGSTTVTYTAQDPGAIMRALIDNYRLQGGTLNYSGTIDLTGLSITITFTVTTILDAINTLMNLSPPGWYWYVDQTTGFVHLHAKPQNATRTFTHQKDVSDVTLEKTLEKTVNVVYLTGGNDGSGSNLYRKYSNATSISKYGQLMMFYNDSNITSSANADLAGQNLIRNQDFALVRSNFKVIDSMASGYDIEVLRPGDICKIVGFAGNTSLWDVAQWDVDRWDFDIRSISSINLQITRINYTAGFAILDVSVLPPAVTRQTATLGQSLQQTKTLANPSIPTSVAV